jgi:hypothetical protein
MVLSIRMALGMALLNGMALLIKMALSNLVLTAPINMAQ